MTTDNLKNQVTDEELEKQDFETEEGTQSARAAANWESNWHEMLPTSGEGRFVYQHHWRGLSDEEIGLTEA